MQTASANLEFERAALLRDQIMEVKERHRPDENRAETQAGEVFVWRCAAPAWLTGVTVIPSRADAEGPRNG